MKFRIVHRTYSNGLTCYKVQIKVLLFWYDFVNYNDLSDPAFFMTLNDAQRFVEKYQTSIIKDTVVWKH